MDHHLTGTFIESCDCFVICPCWVDEEADEGHCTGLVAWHVAPGSTIGGRDVGDLRVVCVTVHGAQRRGGSSRTVVYVDRAALPDQAGLLARAFAGRLGGPLAGLAAVSGDVLATEAAEIIVTDDGDGWSVRVRPEPGAAETVSASGTAELFDDAAAPMTLSSSALAAEFGMGDRAATSQTSDIFRVGIAALPGGYVDVTGRSGMTGAFSYQHAEPMPRGRDLAQEPADGDH